MRPLQRRARVEREPVHVVTALLAVPVRLLVVVVGLERARRRVPVRVACVGVAHRAVRVVHLVRVACVVGVVVGAREVLEPGRARTAVGVVVAVHLAVLAVLQLLQLTARVLPREREPDVPRVVLELPLGPVRVPEVVLVRRREPPRERDAPLPCAPTPASGEPPGPRGTGRKGSWSPQGVRWEGRGWVPSPTSPITVRVKDNLFGSFGRSKVPLVKPELSPTRIDWVL